MKKTAIHNQFCQFNLAPGISTESVCSLILWKVGNHFELSNETTDKEKLFLASNN